MKKILSLLLITSLLLVMFPARAQAEAVTISEKKMELVHGDTFTLKLLNVRERDTIVWNTTNRSVATVNSEGVVSADNVGNAIITAKAGGKKYACKITVVEDINNMRPYDAYSFAIMEVLGNGFYVLDNYTRFGESSFGEDFETTLDNLHKNMIKLSQYNDKITALDGAEYDDFKVAWELAYNELNSLYNEMADKPPTEEKSEDFQWLNFKNADKCLRKLGKECTYFE